MNTRTPHHHTPCPDGAREQEPDSAGSGASVAGVVLLPATLPVLADQADAVHEQGLADTLRRHPQSRASLAYALHVLGCAVEDPDLTGTDCRHGLCRQPSRVEIADDSATPTVADDQPESHPGETG